MKQATNDTQLLNIIPEDRPVALLIRQGGKTDWDELRLKAIGAALGSCLKFVASSKYDYCLTQVNTIISSAGQVLSVIPNADLGNPSILINRNETYAAESSWKDLGHDAITEELRQGQQVLGFNDPAISARRLLYWMLEKAASAGTGISLFISHDIVMLVIMARLFNIQLTKDLWPERFEWVVFWLGGDKFICRYREAMGMAFIECQGC